MKCRKPKERKQTKQQILLGVHLRELGYLPVAEFKVTDDRDFRFDWAQPEIKLAWEVDGGKWTGGHRRGAMIDEENDKINAAQMLGWRVLKFTNDYVWDGRALAFMRKWTIQI